MPTPLNADNMTVTKGGEGTC